MAAIFNKLAFGLEWSVAINDSKKELASLIADHKATVYASASNGSAKAYGFGALKKANGSRSAAALFASICGSKHSLFLHNLDGTQCALIAVDGGMPVEGMDKVGSREAMLSAALSYLAEQKAVGNPVALYGDADYSDWEGEQYEPMSIEALQQGGADIGKMHVVSDVKTKVALVAVGSLVAVGAWFNNEIMAMFEPAKPVVRAESPQSKYHKKVMERIAEIEKADLFRGDVMPAYSEFSKVLPYSAPGWQMEKLVCKDTSCQGTWKRQKGGSADVIQAALKVNKDDTSFSCPTVDQCQKTFQFERPIKQQKLEFSANGTLDPKVLSWIQTLKDGGYEPKYDTPTRLVAPEPNMTPDAADNILVGTYTITVPYKNLADAMQLTNSMTIEMITVSGTENKINAEITGKYYAR